MVHKSSQTKWQIKVNYPIFQKKKQKKDLASNLLIKKESKIGL